MIMTLGLAWMALGFGVIREWWAWKYLDVYGRTGYNDNVSREFIYEPANV